MDLDDSGGLTIYRAGGGIRRGKVTRTADGEQIATLRTVTEPGPPWEGRPEWPYVQYDIKVHFDDELHGRVEGKMYFEGPRSFETSDGGKTWQRL